MTNCLHVILSKNVFCLHCWSNEANILLDIEFRLDKFVFFEPFKDTVPLSSGLHNFWGEVHRHWNHCCSISEVSFSSHGFQYFPPISGLWQFEHDVRRYIFIIFIQLGICWSSWDCKFFFCQIRGIFGHYFSDFFLSLFSFWNSTYTYIRHFDIVL